MNLLHGLIVSHQDSDHAGGAADVLEAVTTGWLMSSLPVGHELHGMARASLPCHAGLSWEWDGVHFAMLHPMAEQLRKRPRKTNDLSCVLMISTEAGRVLLTGDIEAVSERALLQRHAHGEHGAATDIASLQADVLLAPHHGSRTSSTPAFIQAVDAKDVIFPVGYRNRYRHPLPDIEARYRLTGARLHRTDLQGAVSIELPASKPSAHDKLRNASHHRSHINIDNERNRRPRYWYGR